MTTENDWQGYGTVQPYILVHDPIPIRTTACSRPFPYSFQIRYTQLQTDVGQSHTSRILNGCCPDSKLQSDPDTATDTNAESIFGLV